MWVLAGSYAGDDGPGGISAFRFDPDRASLMAAGTADRALQAGYLVHDPSTGTVYAVDERKTDGRGPVGPAASVHAFRFDPRTGALAWLGGKPAPGAFPTFLDLDPARRLLISASHGSFDHVEHVVRDAAGEWQVEYLYDHSTVALWSLGSDGAIAGLADLVMLDGHGKDPNSSPQAGGHAQSSAHAHCATLDPTGRFLVVCDKGTDRVLVFRISGKLDLATQYRFPPETAPRHVAFSRDGGHLFLTLELASELAAMRFDVATGALDLIDRVPATDGPCPRVNEPAEIRLHPGGRFLYINNRGEDSLAWFGVAADGRLTRLGHVGLAASIHPGLAARSFAITPDGRHLVLADRPANCLRVFALDPATGAASEIALVEVQQPAFVLLIAETERDA